MTDSRIKKKCTYKSWDIVCVVLIATLCNCDDWEEIYIFANEKRDSITWDALNTQRETVKAVIEGNGDYIGALKENQGNFYQDVIDYFDEDRLLIIKSGYEGGYALTREKSHSQIITYEHYIT